MHLYMYSTVSQAPVNIQPKPAAPMQSGASQQQVYKVYSKGPNGETKLVQVIPADPSALQNVQLQVTSANQNHVPHNPGGLRQTSILPHAQTIPPHILQQLYAGMYIVLPLPPLPPPSPNV